MTRSCIACGADLSARHWLATRCLSCAPKALRAGGRSAAHGAVARAVRLGALAHPSTLTCVDCGKQARDYDHRDYSKPLVVQPVCRSCNKLRGPAATWPHPGGRPTIDVAGPAAAEGE